MPISGDIVRYGDGARVVADAAGDDVEDLLDAGAAADLEVIGHIGRTEWLHDSPDIWGQP